MPTLIAIHIRNSLQPTLSQKLQKSMSCQRSNYTEIQHWKAKLNEKSTTYNIV